MLAHSLSQEIEVAVQALYDSTSEREWQRIDRHRTEFAVTLRTLAEHLPPPPARILDCGGGPGRYAIELARQGYEVTLFDLSAGNLALAHAKADEAGVSFTAIAQGTATDLSRYGDASFDVVLLMGPLYHLLEEHERFSAVAEVRRVVRPGGLVFAAFITRYAAHRWADLSTRVSSDPVLFGAAEHLLVFSAAGRNITVEIMGQVERREGDGWVSTAASTETFVELDGVPVPLAWLEEEALAYVRRGRLERTAQCLPYCDRDRLLSLLRRETPAAVI